MLNLPYLAGRLVLAVADDDGEQVAALFEEAAAEPKGLLSLVVTLASSTAEAAQYMAGDDWRSVMTTALHVMELEQ